MATRRYWPVPEVLPRLGGRPWKIFESRAAMVQLEERRMWVPLGADPTDANRRAHEMAHARWTMPRLLDVGERRGIPEDALRAVEDGRMHRLLADAGVDLSAGLTTSHEIAEFGILAVRHPFPTRLATLALVACHRTGTSFRALVALCEEVRRRARVAGDQAREAAVAEALTVAGEAGAMLDAIARPRTRDTFRIARWLHETLTDKTPLVESWFQLLHGAANAVDGLMPWGVLRVEEPHRGRTLAGARTRQRTRPTDSGTLPRVWHRWPVDSAVFTQPQRAASGAGTVLVDFSGSMGLGPDSLRRLIERMPDAMIAAYGGGHDSGVLRVLARDGRRVDDAGLASIGGGRNVVDGPALEWLARQPAPRFWVSDGQVTGIGDVRGRRNWPACEALCRERGIRHLQSIAGVLAVLARSAG